MGLDDGNSSGDFCGEHRGAGIMPAKCLFMLSPTLLALVSIPTEKGGRGRRETLRKKR